MAGPRPDQAPLDVGPEADDALLDGMSRAWKAKALAGLFGVACFLLLPGDLGWVTRAVAAWDLMVLLLVAEGIWIILRADPERTRLRAVAEDPGRFALLAVTLGASVVSLLAAVLVISMGDQTSPAVPDWLRGAIGLSAIAGAWALMQVAFTLHYARLYYASGNARGGFEFRGGPPDEADFAYVAFGIGTAFQTPDVTVSNRYMRRVVLGHQVFAFLYNTAILALVINIIAGRL